MNHQNAIAPPPITPYLTPAAPLWSSLLIGTVLAVAAPAVASPQTQVAAAPHRNKPAPEVYLSQSMPNSMPHSMPDSTADPTAAPETSFQRINQPLGVKAVVTVGGLILMAGELWWFLGHHVKTDT